MSSEQSQDGVSVSELRELRTDKLSALKLWSFSTAFFQPSGRITSTVTQLVTACQAVQNSSPSGVACEGNNRLCDWLPAQLPVAAKPISPPLPLDWECFETSGHAIWRLANSIANRTPKRGSVAPHPQGQTQWQHPAQVGCQVGTPAPARAGEDLLYPSSTRMTRNPPPPARGKIPRSLGTAVGTKPAPARAGEDTAIPWDCRGNKTRPRPRGGRPFPIAVARALKSPPPPARGKTEPRRSGGFCF